MRKTSTITRLLTMIMVICMVASIAIVPTFAATIDEATIHMDRTCSVDLYKIDFTNAAKDGVWSQSSYVSTGQRDDNVYSMLIENAKRKGDTDGVSDLGNGQTSNGYAIKGVEFTYLKVADIVQFTESENDGTTHSHVEVLYKIDKTAGDVLLKTIGLADGQKSYGNANNLDASSWYYQSDVLIKALSDALAANATTVKNALENYVATTGGTKMPLTDANGHTSASGMPVGLYLFVETLVPEMVTTTCNPFFLSLPMTTVDGGMANDYNDVTTGGHDWLYNVTLYPKNETGIVTLEKTVREAKKDTGKEAATTTDITEGYKHNATASTNDTLEYQILSTLPTITSASTNISVYTFTDVLSRGLSYDNTNKVKIEFFKNATCKPEDLAATWVEGDGKFTVKTITNNDGSSTRTITMTEAGLKEINTANTTASNNNGALYAGYSNYTMRITYTAILNANESAVFGDQGNPNQVVLTWKRTSSEYLDTLVDDAHVYTYAVNLTKTFSDGKDDQSLFNHVLFNIWNDTDKYYVQATLNTTEGIWYVTGHTTEEDEATDIYPVTWNSTEKGRIVVKGLEDDKYILTEIETANTYTLLKEDIEVNIVSTDDASRPCPVYDNESKLGVIQNDPRYNFDGGLDLKLANIPQKAMAHNFQTASATVDGNKVTMLADEVDIASTNAMVPLNVVNTHAFDLPQTGETTTKWMPIVGGTLAGLAVMTLFVLFLLPKRKEEENRA